MAEQNWLVTILNALFQIGDVSFTPCIH